MTTLFLQQSCRDDEGRHEPDKSDSLTTIEIENYSVADTEKLLLTVSRNSHESNLAKVALKQGMPAITNWEEAQKLGLVDTFYFSAGSHSIKLQLSDGKHFIQVFNSSLEKSVLEIDPTATNQSFFVPMPKPVGHLRIQTAQSTIIGSEMDSCIVKVFDGSASTYQRLDSVHIDSISISPLYQDTTKPYVPGLYPLYGLAYFFNLPVGDYTVVCHDWGKVFAKHYVESRNLTKVQVVKDSLNPYRLVFTR